MVSRELRLSSRTVVSLLVVLAVAGMTGEAFAGRSEHLDYAETRGVELSAPDPDRALVVFLRPGGPGIHSSVYDGEEFLSFVQPKTCFLYDTAPGKHRFMVVSEAADFLAADLKGGKIYFVLVSPRMGMWRARFSLLPITKKDNEWKKLPAWLEKAYLVEPNESAMAWVEENRPSIDEKKSSYLEKWEARPPEERPTLNPGDGVTGL